jgi:hypothetical protein
MQLVCNLENQIIIGNMGMKERGKHSGSGLDHMARRKHAQKKDRFYSTFCMKGTEKFKTETSLMELDEG